MKRKLALTTLLIYILAPTLWAMPDTPAAKYEARAVWLTTIGGIDWPHSYAQSARSISKQKAELDRILDQLQQAGINQVLLQTRIRATTIYPSRYEPWDGCLSGFPGKSPGYDALQYAIDACHRRGMELHAWIVAIPIGKWNGTGCRNLRKTHPGMLRKIGDDGYMNPENPQTARYLADICEEITRRYDIDGIHLDYIRYPETWSIKVPAQRGRDYITHIVRTINQRVKPIKPYLKLSCAPIGKYDDLTRYQSYGWNAYSRVCQDAQGWLQAGLMDELFPMMYFRGKQFYPFAIDWAENTHGRIVAPGLGIYFLSPKEKDWPLETVTREMEFLRSIHLGHAFFRSKFLTDDTKGIYQFTTRHNSTLALVPPMTWACHTAPAAPTLLTLTHGQLTWQPSATEDTIYYNVYASPTYPVDITDGRNLMAIRRTGHTLTVPTTPAYYYAVTATNRYGIESTAAQLAAPPVAEGTTLGAMSHQLSCDGRQVMLPTRQAAWDRQLALLVTDAQGRHISTQLWSADRMSVAHLAAGIYQLYLITPRGSSHRLGFFTIQQQARPVPSGKASEVNTF